MLLLSPELVLRTAQRFAFVCGHCSQYRALLKVTKSVYVQLSGASGHTVWLKDLKMLFLEE